TRNSKRKNAGATKVYATEVSRAIKSDRPRAAASPREVNLATSPLTVLSCTGNAPLVDRAPNGSFGLCGCQGGVVLEQPRVAVYHSQSMRAVETGARS